MLVIGELINGMYRRVGRAIQERDAGVIQKLAKDQVEAGANALDVNTGPYSKNPKDDMKWLVENIQKVVEVTLCIDSTKEDVIEEGLRLAKVKAIINSTNADEEKLERILPLVKKYKTALIGLTMDKSGVPNSKDKRIELGAIITAKCMESGIDVEDLYIDPIILPVNVAQTQCAAVLESITEIGLISDPALKTVLGLSNVSQGTKKRSLINRTYLVMALASGLSAAIVDPLDKELMDAMIAAELLLDKHIYCDSFLDAYKKK